MAAQEQDILISNSLQLERVKNFNEAKFEFILDELHSIFSNYCSNETPVFLFVREGIPEKIAYFMSGMSQQRVSIGVAGESASGKSTFALDMIDSIENFREKYNLENVITRINTDDYYYDRSMEVKKAGSFDNFVKTYDLDSPEALELSLLRQHIEKLKQGNTVWLPKYDMSGTAKRHDNHTVATPAKIIISEGLFTLTDKVRDAFDLKIFVHVDEKIQRQRWFERAKQRSITNSAEEMYQNIIEKSKKKRLSHKSPF